MLVTLKNEKMTMIISTLGAEPQSLVTEGREYIWNGDKEYWFRRAPLLFPIIGPTKNDMIGYKGKEYKMPGNGFARDTEFTLVSQKEDSATFVLEDSEETREKYYPFGFILKVTYTLLENGYKAKAEITAKEDLYYTFGWHPAFSLDINGKGADLETYTLSFEQEEKADRKYAKDGVFVYEKDYLVGDQIELNVRVAMKEDLNYKVSAFLLESGMVYPQESGGDDYIHKDVVRANVSDIYGDRLPDTGDNVISEISFSTAFPENIQDRSRVFWVIYVTRPDSFVGEVPMTEYVNVGTIVDNVVSLGLNGSVEFEYEQ